jgi:hypothetical protein
MKARRDTPMEHPAYPVGVICAVVVCALLLYACGEAVRPETRTTSSRWRPIEAPRAGLECWITDAGGAAAAPNHIECWPVPKEGGAR